MKKTATLFTCLLLVVFAAAQTDSIAPPYKRFPIYPPVKLLLPDSISFYSKEMLPKKKPVMLVLFSPSCEHCQKETQELVDHMDQFRDITIVMATSMPFGAMLDFRKKYGLDKFSNIIVGQDTHYFLFSFYQNRNLPLMAFYNKKKELISAVEGGLPINRIREEFDK